MSKRAVLLAGGKGTRLKPYTVSLPKPLVPVGDMPVIEIIIRKLVKQGFNHITITINHMADIIKAFCGNGDKWGIKIDYTFEEKPLSTMGPLKLIDDLPENFLVMNGDVITDLDLNQFYKIHTENQNIFTISSYSREHVINYGILQTKEQKLIGFKEKPTYSYEVSMGVYMVNRKILEFIPENTSYGFDNLMLDMLKREIDIAVMQHTGYWLDIGRPDDYEQACIDYESNLISV